MRLSPALRASAGAALLAAALAGAGCLQTDGKAVIEKNGSGTLTRSFSIDLKAMKEIEEIKKQYQPGAPAGEEQEETETWVDPAKITETLKARAAKVPGVEIKKLESVEDTAAGRLRVQTEVAFTDLESLAKSGLLINEAVEVRKNADGSFTLEMDPLSGYAKEFASGDGAGGNPAVQGILPVIEPILEPLELKLTLVVPGTLVETNGKKSEDGKSVSWTASWADVKAGKCVRTVTFRGEGIEIKPMKHRPDVMALLKLFDSVPKPKPADPAPGAAPAGEKKPAEPPTTPSATPTDKPVEKPTEKPTEKPNEKPTEKPPTPAK